MDGAEEILHYSFEYAPERPYDGDRDHDKIPDEWVRRKGDTFPQYVGCEIDRQHGSHGNQSLRLNLNGGNFAIYSPIHKNEIDPDYSYVFQGKIRTQKLKNSAAILAVSFLNEKRQRIQHFTSQPITGTWKEWQEVEMKMIPREDVKYAVIGCHLVNQRARDIRGTVWFDDLRIGRKPRLDTTNHFEDHFKHLGDDNIQLDFKIRGLDDTQKNELYLKLTDSQNQLIDEEVIPVQKKKDISWKPSPEARIGVGYYQVYAELRTRTDSSAGEEPAIKVIADTYKSFVVLDLIDQYHADYSMNGEFAWSVNDDELLTKNLLNDMSEITGQAGINWLKYPVWKNSTKSNQSSIVTLFKKAHARGIQPVGVLRSPPPELREKFKADWRGVSEVFNMPRRIWAPSLKSAIAHLSANVQHWQMGGDDDLSFAGGERLDQTIRNVKSHFDIIGRNSKVGVPWRWKSELPDNVIPSNTFLAIKAGMSKEQSEEILFDPTLKNKEVNLPPEELYQKIHTIKSQPAPRQGINKANIPLWVLVKPMEADSGYSDRERADNLVKRIVAAKRGGADQICAMDVFSEKHGLIEPNGSPTLLFLPWRTSALALRNTKYITSLNLNHGSTNHLFERDGEVVMFIWNEEEVEEELFLGNAQEVQIYNVWGQELLPEIVDTRHRLRVNSSPLIIRYCSAEMINFQLGVEYVKGKAAGALGNIRDGVRIKNPFSHGITVDLDVKLPNKDWKLERTQGPIELGGGEERVVWFRLSLPSDVSIGFHDTTIECKVDASDSDYRNYRVNIEKPYQVGLGDIGIVITNGINKNGHLEITQKIINNTDPPEVLTFECKLYLPKVRNLKRRVPKLTNDKRNGRNVHKSTYVLPDPESWIGKSLRIKAEQLNGRRVLNYKWVVDKEGPEWIELEASQEKQAARPRVKR